MTHGRRIYLILGRIVSPAAVVGLQIYSAVTKRPRVRVLVTNEHKEILLIRGVLSRNQRWTLPGGGVNRRESLESAAQRELHEETGIQKPMSDFRYIRTVEKVELGLSFVAPMFHVKANKNDLPVKPHNPSEIADIGWFKSDELPRFTSTLVRVALDDYGFRKK